jgi:dolichol kinase
MRTELPRQLVHLSGLLFIVLAQFIGRETSIAYFLIISLFFLIYSFYARFRERKWSNLIHRFESRFREFALSFERKKHFENPFMGAFWFYFGCFLTLAMFPFHIASSACCILAVGDSVSTLFGIKFGRHEITKGKTLEGSMAFVFFSFVVSLFFVSPPSLALVGSFFGMIAEIFSKVNDNLTIPLVSAFFMTLANMI